MSRQKHVHFFSNKIENRATSLVKKINDLSFMIKETEYRFFFQISAIILENHDSLTV